ncbi:MAG: rhodanese-like domain-containing protein [archaeon]
MIFFAVRVVKSENEISVQELKKMLSEKKKFLLLDCRTKAEFEIAKIGGAKLVPLGELHEKMKEFGQKKEIVVFCHHSGRSKFAAAILSRAGFKARYLLGGIDAWSTEIDLSVNRY